MVRGVGLVRPLRSDFYDELNPTAHKRIEAPTETPGHKVQVYPVPGRTDAVTLVVDGAYRSHVLAVLVDGEDRCIPGAGGHLVKLVANRHQVSPTEVRWVVSERGHAAGCPGCDAPGPNGTSRQSRIKRARKRYLTNPGDVG